MQPRDVYKLLYQSVRGPEHIIASPKLFKERLAEEWEALDPAAGELLWESIQPDGGLLRVNLRPFKAANGNLEALAIACLETGRRSWGTPAELRLAWGYFVTACQEGRWPSLILDEVETFTAWLEANKFPAVHHSKQYRSLYRPAYRLAAADIRL